MKRISLYDATTSLIQEIDDRIQMGGVDLVGYSWGFAGLDKYTLGLRKKGVYYLGGRPGMGKSSLGLTVAANVAKQDKKVLFLSLEMSAELLALRMLSGETGIPSDRIELGKLSKEEFLRVKAVHEATKGLTFDLIDDTMDSESFMQYIVGEQETHGLDFLVVDYISLFRDPSKYGDNERVGRISANLFSIARHCDIPILVLTQLNREVEKRENHMPVLSDIRDSGAVEQDAFCVLFCYRPHYYAMMFEGAEPVECEEDAKIIIAKNRQGESGIHVKAEFHPRRTQWADPNVVITPQPRLGAS